MLKRGKYYTHSGHTVIFYENYGEQENGTGHLVNMGFMTYNPQGIPCAEVFSEQEKERMSLDLDSWQPYIPN